MRLGPLTLGTALVLVAGCGAAAPGSEPDGSSRAAVLAALAVWERGAAAIPVPPKPSSDLLARDAFTREDGMVVCDEGGETIATTPPPFRDFDERVRRFLGTTFLADAVQFSCASVNRPEEGWVQSGLDDPDPLVRLRALVVLMRVRAPRTVAEQWAVLEDLAHGPHAASLAEVTTRLQAAFAPDALDSTLSEPPSGTEYNTPPAYQWALRAAGVTRHRRALSRLAELSRSDLLDVSLAAEASLEDFDCAAGDEALARCVDGWRYNAAMRAASALLRRDPERLRETLLALSPVDCTYWKGVFLARLEDRRAVPILCSEVSGLSIIDREMFDAIERLAGPEDLSQVESLPDEVREEQKARAEEVVAAVRARLARGG